MDIRYINLSLRKDRNELMKRQLMEHGITTAQRFEAVDVYFSDLEPMVDNGFLTVDEYVMLIAGRTSYITKGCIGCYLSHLALYRECVAAQRPMLILEDDVEIFPGLLAKIEGGLASVDNDFDMIYLNQPLGRWIPHSEPVNPIFFAISDGYYCTDGYIIHPRHAALLSGLLEKRFLGHIDNAILTIHHRLGRVRVLLFQHPLIRCSAMGSDVRLPRFASFRRSVSIPNVFFCSSETVCRALRSMYRSGVTCCLSEEEAEKRAETEGGWFVPARLHPQRLLPVPDPKIGRITLRGTSGGAWGRCAGEHAVFPIAVSNFFFSEIRKDESALPEKLPQDLGHQKPATAGLVSHHREQDRCGLRGRVPDQREKDQGVQRGLHEAHQEPL
ncbi:glycosyltransferase family 25 protein [bacterium]|nr:glycosyltransferase family 25 protein [bacterium]